MSGLSVDEHELPCFFEAEPRRADPDVPWPYNSLTYRASIGAYEVSFGVAPAHGDLFLAEIVISPGSACSWGCAPPRRLPRTPPAGPDAPPARHAAA